MTETKGIARISSGTLYRELQGETVLLQIDSGEYFGLDDVATRIWQLIAEKGDLEAIEATMLQEFEVERAEAARDLNRLVGELVQKRLIEIDS
jgi:hypothetical protein